MIGRNRWMFGLLIALAAQGAWAEGGRIMFSGAVVEPTCAVDTIPAADVDNAQVTIHRSCGQGANEAGRSYSRTVSTLDATAVTHDRLLGYYASYAPQGADGQSDAKLVVRTYD